MNKKPSEERLSELSRLHEEGADISLSVQYDAEAVEFARTLDALKAIKAPSPSAQAMWQGRDALLLAVEASREHRAPGGWWHRRLRLASLPAAVATVVILVSGSSAAIAVDLPGSRLAVSEVMSAFGLSERATDVPPVNGPTVGPRTDSSSGIQATPAIVDLEVPPATDGSGPGRISASPAPGSASSGEGTTAPGQLGGNSGQDVEPPGLGGQNPGPGTEPPGLGDENPGQGAEPPGQGGENPGQGTEPPGQSGENPGQGVEPPGLGGENPGQGSEPPGLGGENPGQGNAPPGQGGNNGQGGTGRDGQ